MSTRPIPQVREFMTRAPKTVRADASLETVRAEMAQQCLHPAAQLRRAEREHGRVQESHICKRASAHFLHFELELFYFCHVRSLS